MTSRDEDAAVTLVGVFLSALCFGIWQHSVWAGFFVAALIGAAIAQIPRRP